MFIKTLSIAMMVILVSAFPVYSLADEETTDEKEELNRLLKVLEKHTEIATKTKLNADFVPGMVTVLYGDDLAAKGVENVWEALGLVPGMNLYVENNGVRQVLVRGIGDRFGSGNISYQLNGISANSTLFGTPFPLLDIPVFQIDRIEVIRGPGSAIHGEFANAGVVNVITRQKGNHIFGRYGSFDTYSGGGLFSWSNSEKNLRLSLNLAGMETDGADVQTGPDKSPATVSLAPGKANMARDARSGIFTLDYRDFTFLANYIAEGHGSFFGLQDYLPPFEDRIVATHDHWMLEARQKFAMTSDLRVDLSLGWQNFITDVDNLMLIPPGVSPKFPTGRIHGPHHEQSRTYGGLDFTWNKWKKHTMLLGLDYARTRLDEGWQDANAVPSTGAPTPLGQVQRFQGTEYLLKIGATRNMSSLTLQDEYRISDAFTLTAGLRYDNYDDVGDAFSPRLAGVWRMTDRHILKAQYARAFRPPTFFELYSRNNPILVGNENIKPAISDTYEISYIYNRPQTTFRVSPFFTDLQDLIVVQGGTYANTGGARLKGVELELEQELVRTLKLDANLSYVDTEDLDTGLQIAKSANWLADFGIIYSPRSNMTLNIQYQHVGGRNRELQDRRDKLDGYQTVNLTANLFNLGLRGMTLRAGVKNIFDEDVRYPAAANTYPQDYPQSGRQWWMQISYDF